MEYEIIWHSVVDVAYMVEADSEEDAIERLQIYLVDGHEGNDEGIYLKGATQMRNDSQGLKAILDRAGISYTEKESDLPDGTDTATLVLPGTSGIYFTFITADDDSNTAWKLTEYGTTVLADLARKALVVGKT